MTPPLHVFKIGVNKGRPRIWLDGRHLIEAGFTGGTAYRCESKAGAILLWLDLDRPGRLRKVTGRPDGKPIVDMVGADVETAFPGATHVAVFFHPGRIVIRATTRED